MAYQVDYMSVKDGKSCCDAIGIRYPDSENPLDQKIAVIDGGTTELGD